MNRRQKIAVLFILFVPVIVGLVLLSFEKRQRRMLLLSARPRTLGLVRVDDVIYYSEEHVWQLRELRKDKSIAGVLMRIESPGGAVAPSQEIYEEVLRYRDEGKPLVVSMGNVAASGAYYIASPAMRIFANPGTITGSIGVVLRFPQYYKLMDKLGLDMVTIAAGKFKDIGTPHREMSREERRVLQQLIDDTHEQFIAHVGEVRAIGPDSLRELADGRIFTGRQARELGLVDTLGSYEDALAFLRHHLDLSDRAKVIERKQRPAPWRDMLAKEVLGRIPFIGAARRPSGAYFILENYF